MTKLLRVTNNTELDVCKAERTEYSMKKKIRGSLTVEAVISFAVFISFMFLLLSMVKISLIKITLDNAVTETAKVIAAYSYPLGMFNDIADDTQETVTSNFSEGKLLKDASGKGIDKLFENMFAGKNLFDGGLDSILKVVNTGGENLIKSVILDCASSLLAEKSTDMVAVVMKDIIEKTHINIDEEKLNIKIAKLPMPKKTYKSICGNAVFTEFGLSSSDFEKDDVVIGVEYVYKVTFPFFGSIDMKIKEIAVERAWVYGSSGNIPSGKEGIKMSKILEYVLGNETVYTTKYGNKYHKENCFYLARSKEKTTKNAAAAKGCIPCIRCCP